VGDATAPAELTWALIMAASRRLTNYASLLQQGTWQASSVQPAQNRLGRVLNQRRLGIWGYGKIGKRIASYATAFGMHVIIWGSAASRAQAQAWLSGAASREAFFADSDIVTLHLRLNDATRGIVQPDDLARMKPDALFVNTSRAELLAPDALVHALDAGRPGFAAIDVFETEPVPQTTRCCTVKTSSSHRTSATSNKTATNSISPPHFKTS
jgi:D-3-phosphoglycerate dehydrogenase